MPNPRALPSVVSRSLRIQDKQARCRSEQPRRCWLQNHVTVCPLLFHVWTTILGFMQHVACYRITGVPCSAAGARPGAARPPGDCHRCSLRSAVCAALIQAAKPEGIDFVATDSAFHEQQLINCLLLAKKHFSRSRASLPTLNHAKQEFVGCGGSDGQLSPIDVIWLTWHTFKPSLFLDSRPPPNSSPNAKEPLGALCFKRGDLIWLFTLGFSYTISRPGLVYKIHFQL